MKRGIDFFSFDVDFFEDEKIQFVSARFGIKGEVCAIRLLTRIYRNGYFIKWDEDSAYLFAKVAGKEISPGLVNEVVHELVKRGFFDKTIFDSFAILTSRGIQTRYLKACSRRKQVEMDERYLLVDSSEFKNLKISRPYSSTHSFQKCIHFPEKCIHDVNISEENVSISKQSKVKESKYSNSSSKEEVERSDTKEIIKFFQDNFHPDISSFESETILSLLSEFKKDVLLDAMQIAVKSNVRNLRYVEGILRRKKNNPFGGDEYAASRIRGREVQKKDSTAKRKNKVLTDWSQVSDNWDDYV